MDNSGSDNIDKPPIGFAGWAEGSENQIYSDIPESNRVSEPSKAITRSQSAGYKGSSHSFSNGSTAKSATGTVASSQSILPPSSATSGSSPFSLLTPSSLNMSPFNSEIDLNSTLIEYPTVAGARFVENSNKSVQDKEKINFSNISVEVINDPINSASTSANNINIANANNSNTPNVNNTTITFTGSINTGTINKTRKPSIPNTPSCKFCNQAVVDRTKAIKCSSCLGFVHFLCAESGKMNEDFLRILQKKGNVLYACIKCSPTASKPNRIRIINKEGVEESEELKKAIGQIEFNEKYMKKQAEELDMVLQMNTQLQSQLSNQLTQGASGSLTNSETIKEQLEDAARRNIKFAAENTNLIETNNSLITEISRLSRAKDLEISQLKTELDEFKHLFDKFMNTRHAHEPLNKRPRPIDEEDQPPSRGFINAKRQSRTEMDLELTDVEEPLNEEMLVDNSIIENSSNLDSVRTVINNDQSNILEGPRSNQTDPTILENILKKYMIPVHKEFASIQEQITRINTTLYNDAKNATNDRITPRGDPNRTRATDKNTATTIRDKVFPPLTKETFRDKLLKGERNKATGGTTIHERAQPFKEKTFAEMISKSKIKPNFIRTIRINNENEQERHNIATHLLNSYICQDVSIAAVNKKSKDFIVIKCTTDEDANKLEATINNRYGTAVTVSNIKKSDPKFKIIGVHTDNIQPADFILNLKEQNSWLRNVELTYVQSYTIPTKNGSYQNAIISCDIPTLKRVIEKGTVIVGMDAKNVYEHIDILQCFNCQRYGHVAGTCRSQPSCRNCGGDHMSKLCGEDEKLCCVNCKRDLKNGHRANLSHRATDERCPTRGRRIEALKIYASKN